MAATEYTSAYVHRPALVPMRSAQGEVDLALILIEATAVTADGQTTAIEVEGGSNAEWVTHVGAVAGTDPTLGLILEVSLDGGSTYFPLQELALTDTEENSPVARNVYIPNPTTTTGSNRFPKVRLNSDIGGTDTPSFTLTSWLRPQGAGTDKGLEVLT